MRTPKHGDLVECHCPRFRGQVGVYCAPDGNSHAEREPVRGVVEIGAERARIHHSWLRVVQSAETVRR